MKRAILLSVFSLFNAFLFAQQAPVPDADGSLVKWMSIEEALEKTKTQGKPIILDFYTDWCGWCKKMMQTTYANPGIAQYVNMNFYPVKFNAESKDTIEYLGKKYGPSSNAPKSAHSLAIKLLQSKMMYPSTLFLNNYDKQKNEFAFSMVAQGYLDVKKIEPMLVYELENVFRNSGFEEFDKLYNKAFYDTTVNEKNKQVKWLKPTEFFVGQDSTKKKTMVLIHTDWCNACKVMHRTSFIDSATEKYLREKFELVDFNPEITEPLVLRGQTFSNPRLPQMPFHQLAVALCKNSLTLPTLVVLDEKLTVLDAVPFYLNPTVLKNIATYYGDDIYKKKSWTDYLGQVSKP
jgi:thioredoxin-related protein